MRRSLRSFLFYLVLFLSTIVIYLVVQSLVSPKQEKYDSMQDYVQAMQPGWNLGNTFDAVGLDETAWGNPYVTHELIKQLADQGFKSIRIPVTFDQKMNTTAPYTINEDFLSRLDQVIQWSLEEGLFVMINIHHDSWMWLEFGMQQNHDETINRYDAIWTQLADRYKFYSQKLMFESINEPRFTANSDLEKQQYLDELNQHFYEIVRNSGGDNSTRPLVIPSLDTGSDPHKISALRTFIDSLQDPYIIATVHYYGFWPFSVNIAGTTTFDQQTKADLISVVDRVHDTFVKDGIPVIIGEYGLLGFDTDLNAIQHGEKLKYFEAFLHYTRQKQLTHMLWDNGQHFHRAQYTWSDPMLAELMKTSWTTRSAIADTDSIYLKNNSAITDKSIVLELNGHTFTALKYGQQELQLDADYRIEQDTIILRASLLESLIDQQSLGLQASLLIEFSGGQPWPLNVIVYDTAQLEATSGTTTNFTIPLQYNGDTIATLEAVHDNGQNAGPQNWTSFKEYAFTFKPNYNDNTLLITQPFFNETNDGKIKLTIYFWSGQQQEYWITKNGTEVVGSSTP